MDINTIIQIISTIGFPIAMCLAMMYYISKSLKEFQSAINNNTKAVTELCAMIKKGGADDD